MCMDVCCLCAHKKCWTCTNLKIVWFCSFVCLCFYFSYFWCFCLSFFALSAYIYSRSLILLLLGEDVMFVAFTGGLFSLTLVVTLAAFPPESKTYDFLLLFFVLGLFLTMTLSFRSQVFREILIFSPEIEYVSYDLISNLLNSADKVVFAIICGVDFGGKEVWLLQQLMYIYWVHRCMFHNNIRFRNSRIDRALKLLFRAFTQCPVNVRRFLHDFHYQAAIISGFDLEIP